MTPLKPPPEAVLIATKRDGAVPRLSMREAARLAGISATRWRQLEAGTIRVKGTDYPEKAPAETLALMAQAVGATPEELRTSGRDDAAAILVKILAVEPDAARNRSDASRMVDTISGLSRRQRETLEARIAEDLDQIRRDES